MALKGDDDSAATNARKLVIFGTEDFADIAFEYFTHDSEYEVVAFTVHQKYIQSESKFGLPVVPFEGLDVLYPPGEHSFFAAIVYARLNRLREEVCNAAKARGYTLARYISSRAFVWRNAEIGEHCFIFEDNTIQPFVKIEDNVVLWSGNHIGHHSTIHSNCFLTSHVVVSGWCEVGKYCFLGVNTTLANNTSIGEGSWVNHGAILSGDIPEKSLIKANSSEVLPLNEAVLFRSLARSSRSRNKSSPS